MKKKNLKIVKFISFLLLIFSFNLNVNAETTKIYYADSRGIRKPALTAPEGYPNNGGGAEVTLYSYRTVKNTYDPTKYYACSTDAESTVVKYQQVPCGSEGSLDPTFTYTKEEIYSCAKTQSDTVPDLKIEQGKKCKEFSDWTAGSTEKPTEYDESNTELYKSATATWYFWYKEVNNATTINFENNKALYDAIKSKISSTYIKDAEINFLENPLRIVAGDITKVKKLDFSNADYPIVTIDELGYFTGLTTLDLRDNKIVKIDAIKNLANLDHLNLCSNFIVSIEPIIGLKKLEELYLCSNEITNLKLLKKIENYSSIEKNYYENDFKKSGLIKSWSEFVEEFSYYMRINFNSRYNVKGTKDSIILSDTTTGKSLAEFEYKNNILKYVSGDPEVAEYLVIFLLEIGNGHSEMDKLLDNCSIKDTKCWFTKFGDYIKINVTFIDGYNNIDKMSFSFDMRYFYGDSAAVKNPKTGVSNALVLLGITLMCNAIGFVVIYKHKTGIQL